MTLFMLQEAATSTQEGSSDSQSSTEEKIIIALHKETEQTDMVISEPIDDIKPQTGNHVTGSSATENLGVNVG